jgi:DNA-binding transcriptional LysR family regulator
LNEWSCSIDRFGR